MVCHEYIHEERIMVRNISSKLPNTIQEFLGDEQVMDIFQKGATHRPCFGP